METDVLSHLLGIFMVMVSGSLKAVAIEVMKYEFSISLILSTCYTKLHPIHVNTSPTEIVSVHWHLFEQAGLDSSLPRILFNKLHKN